MPGSSDGNKASEAIKIRGAKLAYAGAISALLAALDYPGARGRG